MALLHLMTAAKYKLTDDAFEGPETQPHIKSPNLWIIYGWTQNTLHLLSVYDQACNFTSSNHIHNPNIFSTDRENHNVISAKHTL